MINESNVQIDDLEGDLRDIADTIGMNNTVKLMELFGGCAVYIPMIDRVQKKSRDRMIRSEFNGSNYRDLADKYNLSVVWIRKIVGNN